MTSPDGLLVLFSFTLFLHHPALATLGSFLFLKFTKLFSAWSYACPSDQVILSQLFALLVPYQLSNHSSVVTCLETSLITLIEYRYYI